MINANDTEFHPRDPRDRIWTETTYLAFAIPEEALHGTLYVLARPNLGVAMSSVVITRGYTRRPHEAEFCDPQIHLPCPASYADFSLDNGLSVKAESLTDWRFSYRHKLDSCRFDLRLKGLHHPHDPMDSRENPLLQRAEPGGAHDPRVGDAWSNGHFDLKGRITGTLWLRGREYAVDCYEGMDRSWGPRNETPSRASSYLSINFGEELAVWLTMTLSISSEGMVVYDELKTGFLVSHGEVFPITRATIEARGADMLTLNDHVILETANGARYEFHGGAIGTRPMGSINPSISAFQSLMRYHWNGKVGYGGHGKLFGQEYLARHLPRDEARA
ncbi:hypothetical protein FOZ76_02495 [Verticiella sediminum]|uniref:AttH domain-containing protein n=1 Tax=Verticiella sediminum TaxID=1247510 RepID=A0A556B0B1_9BURK|nr:hypothetical protein [Verticiella sediminum]TSH98638.1 hypothetical protein FOZ76_02495 [Verticiella sediminum]